LERFRTFSDATALSSIVVSVADAIQLSGILNIFPDSKKPVENKIEKDVNFWVKFVYQKKAMQLICC